MQRFDLNLLPVPHQSSQTLEPADGQQPTMMPARRIRIAIRSDFPVFIGISQQ